MTATTAASAAQQLAQICHDAGLVSLGKRRADEPLEPDERAALKEARRALKALGTEHPECEPACAVFRKEIRRIAAMYMWECMECSTSFNHTDEMIEDEGMPTCPGCNSQDVEPTMGLL